MNTSNSMPDMHEINAMLRSGNFNTDMCKIMSSFAEKKPKNLEKESPEYEQKQTSEILAPEMNLQRLGCQQLDNIDWSKVLLPEKRNLYLELHNRIANFMSADCEVVIGTEKFNCHLMVLQCYSQLFQKHAAVKRVGLQPNRVSPKAFRFIYEWMVNRDIFHQCLTRNNIVDIYAAAKYLQISDLIDQCLAFIKNVEVFNEESAYLIFSAAKKKKLDEVRDIMLPRIRNFFFTLVSSEDWLNLDFDDVILFLNSDHIKVNDEMEILMAAIRWLRHDVRRNSVMVDLMRCVRFANVSPWQLIDMKHNAESHEFNEITIVPEIKQLFDEGLAYEIISHCYVHLSPFNAEYFNSIPAQRQPLERNWTGDTRTYMSYRDFLIFLDKYRRNSMWNNASVSTPAPAITSGRNSANMFIKMPSKLPPVWKAPIPVEMVTSKTSTIIPLTETESMASSVSGSRPTSQQATHSDLSYPSIAHIEPQCLLNPRESMPREEDLTRRD